VDFQGWASDHPYLTRAIDEVQPSLIVEIGAYRGGAVMTMADPLRLRGLDGVVLAVDTWLGAWGRRLRPVWLGDLRFEGGYPSLFRTFSANVIERGLADHVVPLPLDSVNAVVVKARGLRPDIVHVDAAHDYDSVSNDLRLLWPLLRPGGVLIGDDYHETGDVWADVRRAFQDLFRTKTIENAGSKCYITKTA